MGTDFTFLSFMHTTGLPILFLIALVASALGMVNILFGYPRQRERRQVNRSAKRTAEQMVGTIAYESDELAFKWLRGAGWAVAPFALPVGAAAILAGNIALATKNGLNLRKARMPESWVNQVALESSLEGKRYLGGKLKKQGYITVAQAAAWLELEAQQKAASYRTPSVAGEQLIAAYDAQPGLLDKLKQLAGI
jgi:hypothetical protein